MRAGPGDHGERAMANLRPPDIDNRAVLCRSKLADQLFKVWLSREGHSAQPGADFSKNAANLIAPLLPGGIAMDFFRYVVGQAVCAQARVASIITDQKRRSMFRSFFSCRPFLSPPPIFFYWPPFHDDEPYSRCIFFFPMRSWRSLASQSPFSSRFFGHPHPR